ncbi:MAG: glycerol-3-phosphate 1-O-acyltransferase PlsY [Deltaproteobacteria bacterium]|nr:MAG: glycerol-3-phosphate 1-O-acyltransferase PlsY [Deltaproteobacteria bacterium]
MEPSVFFITLAVIYLIAAIPTGVVLTRLMGFEDVRTKGSGNIGATNVYRVAGKLPGILTLCGDILKGFLPLLAVKLWLAPTPLQLGLTGVVAIVGHCYPVYLRFKGGKGVATALGIFLVLDPLALLGACLVFLGAVLATRYISLGSVLAAVTAPLLTLLFHRPLPLIAGAGAIGTLIVWRHRDNLRRLLAGTENRFGAKPPTA